VPADQNVTIPANSTYTYSKQWSTPYAGTHSFQVVTYRPGIGYDFTYPSSDNSGTARSFSVAVKSNPRLTTSLTLNPSQPAAGQSTTVSYTITNSSSNPVSIGSPFVVVRGPQGQNLDVPADQNVTIPANSTYTYSKQWSTPYAGTHSFQVVTYRPGIGYDFTYPSSDNSGTARSFSVAVKSNPRLTTSLTLNPSQPAAGQTFTASFSIRNDSDSAVDLGYPFVVIRGPQGQNLDISISGGRVSIPANSTYTYSKQWSTPYAGIHTLGIATWIPEKGILSDYPVSESGVTRSATVVFR
jgi:hypothetical protein